MGSSKIYPRTEQIEELCRGVSLPAPQIQPDLLEIIAEGLHSAYKNILISTPWVVATRDEAEITSLLESQLNNLIGQDPLLRQLIYCVVRGKESISFDGSYLEKRPDLSIYLTRRNSNFPLIVEAKIIEAKNGKTVRLYCEKGLRRFIKGEYSWGTQEAFMMAYVRDGSSVMSKLTPFLSKLMTTDFSTYLVEELPKPVAKRGIDLSRSKHGRKFVYTNQAPPLNTPGSIALWHLWLS